MPLADLRDFHVLPPTVTVTSRQIRLLRLLIRHDTFATRFRRHTLFAGAIMSAADGRCFAAAADTCC